MVRLLSPGLGQPAGAFAELPQAEADRLIAAGAAFTVLSPIDEPPAGPEPLGQLIRRRVADDAEICGLRIAARAYAGSARLDPGRPAAAAWQRRALARINAPLLPQTINPAAFTGEAFRLEFGIEPAGGWYAVRPGVPGDVVGMILHHARRRLHAVLIAIIDSLRDGRRLVTGIPAAGGHVAALPPDLWDRVGIAIDLRNSAIVAAAAGAGALPLFVSLEVQRPAVPGAPGRAARSALAKFVEAFSAAMAAAGRRFTVCELTTTARQHLGEAVSGREAVAALRRASPPAWANGDGRRPAGLKPTATELVAAGRSAAAAAAEARR
jgi:hypothetical protein